LEGGLTDFLWVVGGGFGVVSHVEDALQVYVDVNNIYVCSNSGAKAELGCLDDGRRGRNPT
jgi:hypothetical protein